MTKHDAIKHLSYKIAYCKGVDRMWVDGVNVDALEIAVRAMAEERQKAKWIKSDDTIIRGTCSCCGWNAITAETDVVGMPYCPNCGADMRGEENENN